MFFHYIASKECFVSANWKGLLLTTDVAARGLDIPDVQHVLHYQVSRTTEVGDVTSRGISFNSMLLKLIVLSSLV